MSGDLMLGDENDLPVAPRAEVTNFLIFKINQMETTKRNYNVNQQGSAVENHTPGF